MHKRLNEEDAPDPPPGQGDRTRAVRQFNLPFGLGRNRRGAIAAIAILVMLALTWNQVNSWRARSAVTATPAATAIGAAGGELAAPTPRPTALEQVAGTDVVDVASGGSLTIPDKSIAFRYKGNVYVAQFINNVFWARPEQDSGFKQIEGSDLFNIATIERGGKEVVLTFK